MKKVLRYKLVRCDADGYRTLHAGSTQRYVLGESYREPARASHGGGFYVHRSPDLGAYVSWITVPEGAYAVLECEVWGKALRYGTKKEAWSCLRPRREVSRHTLRAHAGGRAIPENWRVAVIQAKTISRPRHCPISITLYELRAYDPVQGPYWRTRRNGYNPIILARTTSGHGAPTWMQEACDA